MCDSTCAPAMLCCPWRPAHGSDARMRNPPRSWEAVLALTCCAPRRLSLAAPWLKRHAARAPGCAARQSRTARTRRPPSTPRRAATRWSWPPWQGSGRAPPPRPPAHWSTPTARTSCGRTRRRRAQAPGRRLTLSQTMRRSATARVGPAVRQRQGPQLRQAGLQALRRARPARRRRRPCRAAPRPMRPVSRPRVVSSPGEASRAARATLASTCTPRNAVHLDISQFY